MECHLPPSTFPCWLTTICIPRLCHHAVGAPLEYVAAARAAGLAEVGFSDHSPMADPEPFDDWRMPRAELPRYVDWVLEARERSAPFPVRLGLECDFIVGHEAWIEELATLAPWDYLIGSVHYLAPGWAVDDPRHISRFTASDTAAGEIWALYWREYERCVASGLFDFVAHPDLVKKFGHRPDGDLRRYYEPAIAARRRERYGHRGEHGGPAQAGGRAVPVGGVSLDGARGGGARGHQLRRARAEEVGQDFARAADAVRAAGYTETARFAGRRRRPGFPCRAGAPRLPRAGASSGRDFRQKSELSADSADFRKLKKGTVAGLSPSSSLKSALICVILRSICSCICLAWPIMSFIFARSEKFIRCSLIPESAFGLVVRG